MGADLEDVEHCWLGIDKAHLVLCIAGHAGIISLANTNRSTSGVHLRNCVSTC